MIRGHISVTRQPWEKDWNTSQLFVENGDAVLNYVRELALDKGCTLKSDTPELGWALKAGEQWIPCGEHTNGASTFWIWWAE